MDFLTTLTDAELIQGYKYDNKQLPVPPAREADCDTNEKLSAFWLVRILRKPYVKALEIVLPAEEFDPRKPLVRLLNRKHWRKTAIEIVPCRMNLDRDHKAQALAAYMFCHGDEYSHIDATVCCKQCSSTKSRGPCLGCVRPANNRFAGACTNCKYSGTPNNCSFAVAVALERKEAEAADRLEAIRNGEALVWFDRDDLIHHSRRDLEYLRAEIEAALDALPKAGRTFTSTRKRPRST